jgi:pimeloyl-ACP methyl ester carboxylesterase
MPLLPDSIRKKVIPIAKISEKRKDIWSDKEGIFASYRKKRVFKHFSDTALQDFIDAAIKPTDNQQYTLTYPKSWETQVYITAPSIFKKLTKVQIPIIAIKGAHSNVITDEIWEKWQKAQPQNEFLEYPNSGHLVPLEYPNEIASWIMERL